MWSAVRKAFSRQRGKRGYGQEQHQRLHGNTPMDYGVELAQVGMNVSGQEELFQSTIWGKFPVSFSAVSLNHVRFKFLPGLPIKGLGINHQEGMHRI